MVLDFRTLYTAFPLDSVVAKIVYIESNFMTCIIRLSNLLQQLLELGYDVYYPSCFKSAQCASAYLGNAFKSIQL